MYKFIGMLAVLVVLAGCAKDPVYLESLQQGEHLLRSEKAVQFYEKYYEYPQHKAFAQSKNGSLRAYASYKTNEIYAIEDALARCNTGVLKYVDKLTLKDSCEVLNINNEWVIDGTEKAKFIRFLEKAKIALGSDFGLEKYESYYYESGHKAFAHSKVDRTTAYVASQSDKNMAAKLALDKCYDGLLEAHPEMTAADACEIAIIDNEWANIKSDITKSSKYKADVKRANKVIKNLNARKMFESYYRKPYHKALVQGKNTLHLAYSTNKSSAKLAIDTALSKCHENLLKEYPEITDEISCEVINVNNEWVTSEN
ncbi:hypothetical protein OFY17_10185 [Marinomonas sp. C2222]|uniref:DUF3829 domain-containing protein n=1 Tax=Marinomonas sargassi TaxID=2984494 RepID=A0ABT2YTM6_9GAMM|nr:hypothetical protein [Marinomonas sargassi]MCV2403247.1 hypothetical protein [Marinomonas sargassi]